VTANLPFSVTTTRRSVRAAMEGQGYWERGPDLHPEYYPQRVMAAILRLRLQHQCLNEYAFDVLPQLEQPLVHQFCNCSRQQQQSILARMRGFEQRWHGFLFWPRGYFMQMLLDNEHRRHPRV